MFDPLLPFRIMDIRRRSAKDEQIGGSRNRLMKLAAKGNDDAEDQGRNSVVHHHAMKDIVPIGYDQSGIGLEYWVVEAKRKSNGELHLRSSSYELFVQKSGFPPGLLTVGARPGGSHPR